MLPALGGERLAGWLILPGRLIASVCALLALYYASFSIRIPAGDLKLFVVLTVLALVLMQGVIQLFVRRRLRTLRTVDAPGHVARKAELAGAVTEVLSLPDAYALVAVGVWVVGAALIGVGTNVLGEAASWELTLRVASLGVMFGPLTSLLSAYLQTVRARALAIALAGRGLTQAELAAAVPKSRLRIRTRLLITMAVLTVVPSLLSGHVAVSIATMRIEAAKASSGLAVREAAETLYGDIVGSAVVLFSLVLGLAIAVTYYAATSLVVPLTRISRAGRRIASGDLSESERVLGELEVWLLSTAYRRLQERLRATLVPLHAAGVRLTETTDQLSGSVEEQRTGAAEQASALTETSATTEELARSAGHISENAAEVTELAQKTLRAARAGQRSSQAFLQAMEGMTRQRKQIAEAVLSLNERVQRVGKIVDFINGISDKSDLLALNAELEGTKAGEVGRGFSLVAAEMRRLAENTLRSTQEISRLIHEIREASQIAVLTTEGGLRVSEQAAERAEEISRKLGEILGLAEKTTGDVGAIRSSTIQQQTSTDQLARAMEQVLKVTEESSQESTRLERATETLQEISQSLAVAMRELKLESPVAGGAGPERRPS